jgi:hypothetical protein
MNYVPGYAHDIFVSYAQVDDLSDEEGVEGWVTTLIKKLRNRLAQLLGRQDNFSLWFDHHLAHNVNITPEITRTLENTAALVVVLSPGYLASEWCNRERDTFLRLVQERMGGDSRVFLVERDKVELEKRPAEFGDLLGYRFWVQDREGRPPRILGMPHSQGDSTYFDVLNDLAWELSGKLKQLKDSGPPAAKPAAAVTATAAAPAPAVPKPDGATTVYLAEVTDELDTLRTKLIRNLQQRNFRVIPDTWYPREPDAFRKAVEAGLNEADLFVQLLSGVPGRKPPGLAGGYVGFQHIRAKEIGLPVLQWRSPALDVPSVERDVEDPEHQALLLGASVLAVDIEDFSREIIRQAERAKDERQKDPPRDAFVFVNVNLDYDGTDTAALCRYFEQHGISYSLPIQSGQAEEIREDIEANLLECDGMIVVYGRVSNLWVRGQLREFRKLAYRRAKAARALAVFEWSPVPKDPIGMGLPNLTTIDCTTGMDESRLRPFLDALLKGVVA